VNLTRREIQYLKLAVYGGTKKEHANTLGISRKTVEKHSENIYKKLGAYGCHYTGVLTMLQFGIREGYVDFQHWLKSKIR